MRFTIVTLCAGGHGQRFALAGVDRAWADQMAGMLDGSLPQHAGACNRCGAKVTAEVHEHGKATA